MLSLLTKYLVQHKRVCIPHIGTFEIVQQPPALNVADQRFTPPFFTTRFVQDENVPEHQWKFLLSAHADAARQNDDLSGFGKQLKSLIKKDPFRWNGFGTLSYSSGSIVFEPDEIVLPSLSSLPAEKVRRENAQHQVLVGDQEMTRQVSDIQHGTRPERNVALTVGWILLALAVLGIAAWLYFGGFNPAASGSQFKWNW
ncbi:MAG TPA: hypothetical protein VFR58_03270 [Flavisolibacter sp.]|nr:hypothetical protein [Flavisolibacter sp.]